MEFFSSLKDSLYSVEFYKRVLHDSIKRGLLYLVGWSLLISALFAAFLIFKMNPEVKGFVSWFSEAVPPIQMTPQGPRMNHKSPYEMKHPRYGHIATINLDQKEIANGDLGGAMVYMTSHKLYIKETRGSAFRVYDLTAAKDPQAGNMIIDGEMIRKLEKTVKPIAYTVMLIFVFMGFFVWKLTAALIYSLVGTLINVLRREKLPYESVLNVSCFALTGSICAQLFLMVFQELTNVRMPFGFLGSFVLTSTYLYLGIKFTEEEPEPENPGPKIDFEQERMS